MILPAALWLWFGAELPVSVPSWAAGSALALLVWFRCRCRLHWISKFVIDVLWGFYFETHMFRMSVSFERKYETSFLICNCGEFHGMFDKQGMIELVMAVVCFEVVVLGKPLSILRGVELVLLLATWIQLSFVNVMVCALLLCSKNRVNTSAVCVILGGLMTIVQLMNIGLDPIFQKQVEDRRADRDNKLDAIASFLNSQTKKDK